MSTLLPSTATVRLSGGQTVTVCELPWRALPPLLNRAGACAPAFTAILNQVTPETKPSDVGSQLLSSLPTFIPVAVDVIEGFVSGCVEEIRCGPLTLDQISVSDMARLLDASIALTLTPEAVGLARAFAHRTRGLGLPQTN
ncbi:MAG: hypothetical protein KIT22_08870 [Verrucomicrobiae bacterium]|nr:hypothetical protein [Verrucomicrobiae bacterium]